MPGSVENSSTTAASSSTSSPHETQPESLPLPQAQEALRELGVTFSNAGSELETGKTLQIRLAAKLGRLPSLQDNCEALLQDNPEGLDKILRSPNSPLLIAAKADQGPALASLLEITKRLHPTIPSTIQKSDFIQNRFLKRDRYKHEDLVAELRSHKGHHLLYYAIKVRGDSALTALKQELSQETLEKLARARTGCERNLFEERVAWSIRDRSDGSHETRYPSREKMAFLYSLLSEEEKDKALKQLKRMALPYRLFEIAEHGEPDLFLFVYGLVAEQISTKELFCCRNAYGRGILHNAVGNRHGAGFLLDLLRDQEPEVIKGALAPTSSGTSAFYLAAQEGQADTILRLAEIIHGLGPQTAASCFAQPERRYNLLSRSINENNNEGATLATISALRTYFPQELEGMMRQPQAYRYDSSGILFIENITPLATAFKRNCPLILKAITELYLAYPTDIIATTLIAEDKEFGIMRRLITRTEGIPIAIKLLDRLSNEEIEAALQVEGTLTALAYPEFVELLMRRFPDANSRLGILLRARRHAPKQVLAKDGILKTLLGPALSNPCAQFLFYKDEDPRVRDIYPELRDTFAPKIAALEAEHKAAQGDWWRQSQLKKTVAYYQKWTQKTFIELARSAYSQEEVAQLVPYLDRIQHLHFYGQQRELTRIMKRLIPVRKLLRAPEDFQAPGRKQMILHHPIIQDLKLAGLDARLLEELQESIEAQGSKLSPTGGAGRELLQLLFCLHELVKENKERCMEDSHAVLARIVQGDFMEELRAMDQFQSCAPETLRAVKLKEHDKSLKELAYEALRELLPVGKMDDFDERYQAFSSRIREPSSLITYASRMSRFRHPQESLGMCMRHVLLGSFQQLRYSADKSVHLTALYDADASLKTRLPGLCEKVEGFKVGASDAKTTNFDHVRAFVRDKVLDDQMLDADAFPNLHSYLKLLTKEGKIGDKEQLKGVRKDLGIKAGALRKALREEGIKPHSDQECLRLDLECQLIAACMRRTSQEVRGDLRKAITLAGKLEGDFKEFIEELEGQVNSLAAAEHSVVDDYEVSLTDDFWDLMRCGTDVSGSCQRLNESYGNNRHLLGYVMNGFVFPVVVRKPKSEYIEARRLLIVTLGEDGKPALFLERSYTNNSHPAIDDALVRMAKKAADYLNVPLYSKSVAGGEAIAQLKVGMGASDSIYSDAAGGPKDWEFSISHAHLVYRPSQASSSAAASSSSSAKRSTLGETHAS